MYEQHISSKSSVEKLLARDDIFSFGEDLDALDPKMRSALLAFKGIGTMEVDEDSSSDNEDDDDDDISIEQKMELEYDPEYDSEYDEDKVPANADREEFESDEEEEEHRLQDPEEHLFMPHGDSNPTETMRRGYLYPDELLHDFIPATHSERHNSTNQVNFDFELRHYECGLLNDAFSFCCRVRGPAQVSSSVVDASQC